jgi:hypothetical protein
MDLRGSLGKTGGVYRHAIVPRNKIVDAKFSAIVRSRFAAEGRFPGEDNNLRGSDSASGQILNGAAERAAGILGKKDARQ